MNLSDFTDKAISLIVWNTEKENDVTVYSGSLQTENDETFFVNEEEGWKVSLSSEQLEELRPVPDELKETLLDADYALSMSMAYLPESGRENYRATGMKWEE
jgi:hypothetical protein